MIVTCVYIHVKPESTDDFVKASEANHLGSVQEPGNICFDLIQQADDPSRFMFYEAYESEGDVSAHKNTPHYLKWRETVQDMMAEPRKGVRYTILQPKTRAK